MQSQSMVYQKNEQVNKIDITFSDDRVSVKLILTEKAMSYWLVHFSDIHVYIYYIDTDEIPGFLLLLKNHIFTTRSEDTIFIFHVWGYWCGHDYQHNYTITIELLAQARGQFIWNFIHKMASRWEDGRVIQFFSFLLEFWLIRTENISIIFFISPLQLYIRVS